MPSKRAKEIGTEIERNLIVEPGQLHRPCRGALQTKTATEANPVSAIARFAAPG